MSATEQQASALEAANAVRSNRVALKAAMNDGSVKPWLVILDPPAYIHGVDCFAFCSWLPRVGRERTTSVLRKAGIASHRQIGALTEDQRERLSAAIFDRLHATGKGL